jgi:AraC family transcriptional regulator
MAASAFAVANNAALSSRSELVVERCSAQRGWRGLHLEMGHNKGCDVQDMTLHGHVIGMQITGQPLRVETFNNGCWVDTVLPTHRLFIHPRGTPLNIRHADWTQWAVGILDHPLLTTPRQISDSPPSWDVQDDILANLFSALLGHLIHHSPGSPSDRPLAQSMIQSLVLALQHRQQIEGQYCNRGGISPHMMAKLKSWMIANISEALKVQEMAELIGYSPSHFAREFKRSAGMTPCVFLMDLRLGIAVELIAKAMPIREIAQECGFADQSHFSNAFKARYGLSPSQWMRRPGCSALDTVSQHSKNDR